MQIIIYLHYIELVQHFLLLPDKQPGPEGFVKVFFYYPRVRVSLGFTGVLDKQMLADFTLFAQGSPE